MEFTPTDTTYSGIRVLDLTTTIAGPFASMILADLGADVIKIERPDKGDDARGMPPMWDGWSSVFLAFNRNKRSICLDLKSSDGLESALKIAEQVDVVIEGLRPGATDRLGLSYEAISARNPDVIYCSVSAFGNGSYGSKLAGYDPVVQAFCGIMAATGEPNTGPVRAAASIVDLSTGMWGAMAVMAAIERRRKSGKGEKVEATLVDSGYNLMSHQLLATLATGESPERLGSASPITAPYEAFKTRDGWILIAAGNPNLFERLCRTLERPDLIDDPRFATMSQRTSNRGELHREIEIYTSAWSTKEGVEILIDAGIPVGPVNTLNEAAHDPLVEERDLLVSLEFPRIIGHRKAFI